VKADQARDISRLTDENAELRNQVAALQRGITDLASRFERLEQQGADKPNPPVLAREREQRTLAEERTRHEHGWWPPSNESMSVGASVVAGVVSSAAPYMTTGPAETAIISGNLVAIGVAGIAWARRHREDWHARRSQD
jgi:anti-sigma-K factor RskA